MFSTMKLGAKVTAGFTAIMAVALLMGGVGIWGLQDLGTNINEVGRNRLPSVASLLEIEEAMTALKSGQRTLLIPGLAAERMDRQLKQREAALQTLDKAWKVYEPLPQTKEEEALWKQFVPLFSSWKEKESQFVKMVGDYRSSGSPAAYERMREFAMGPLSDAFNASDAVLTKVTEINQKLAEEAVVASVKEVRTATAELAAAIGVLLLIGIGLSLYLSRNIRSILTGLQDEAQRLSEAAVNGRLATRADVDRINFEFRGVVEGMNATLDAVIGPLNVAAEYVDRISKGDIPPQITDNYNGDFNEIKNNLNQCIIAVNLLVSDAKMLSLAAVDGKLATRADASKHRGDFQAIVEGVNQTLDAVIGPLNVAAEYVDRISKGDIPPQITDSYSGDFNEIKNNLNQCIVAVNALVSDAAMLSQAAVTGRINTRADAGQHQGDFRKIVDGVNETISRLVGFIDAMPAPAMIIDNEFSILYMNKLGASVAGRTPAESVGIKCYEHFKTSDCRTDKCACGRALSTGSVASSETDAHPMNGVDLDIAYNAVPIKDQNGKVVAAFEVVTDLTAIKQAERLSTKIAHYQQIETEKLVNDLTRLAQGNTDIHFEPAAGDGDTQGVRTTFQVIGDSVNRCVESINALVSDANMLSKAAVEGKLATRADASKHQGDYKAIVDGVNQTLDAVIGPLNVAAEYVDRISKGDIPPRITDNYNGDFNEIKNNLNQCISAVNALVADANMLAEAAVGGRLSTRADASKHQGDFKAIVDGVNQTLDAVIGPLNVAAEYVDRISKGDVPPQISDSYSGDFNEIKNNLNVLIESMNTVTMAAEQIAVGDLSVEVRMRSSQDQLMKALNQMVSQLKGLAETAEKIAAGDLTVTVKPSSDKDMMGNAFATMVGNLREIVGNVSTSSDAIASASRQIATGNSDLAQRTEEQASSLEETAASMEEMTSTVKQNADNAQQANQLAIDASEVAVKGGDVIGRVVTTMDSISASSKKIADIIGVIDGIAFQTNILALNAAVEAARAGEQGRGFAVVAGEVRNLAQRSAAAAKEIKSLISDSVDRVNDGSKLVADAGQTMQEIVTSIKRVTDIMAEISAASVEQSSGIEQVNTAITQMDEITQQNSTVVQQAAAAANSLEDQARVLIDAVNRFKLEQSQKLQVAHADTGSAVADVLQKTTKHLKKNKANGYQSAKPGGHAAEAVKPAKAVGHDEEWSEF